MKHKHYDVIVAWLEGKDVQYRRGADEWKDCSPHTSKCFVPDFQRTCEFRIKPEPKPDVVKIFYLESNPLLGLRFSEEINPVQEKTKRIRCTFNGESGNLKAVEMI